MTEARPAQAAGSAAIGDYRYRITPTGSGSQKYGNCQVCGGHCDSTYIQVEERRYSIPGVRAGWTQNDCLTYFGHRQCLISKRRAVKERVRDKWRRLRPLYVAKGFELNWNPRTKKFYVWREGQIFIDCVEFILSFKNSDELWDVSEVEENIGFLQNKIDRYLAGKKESATTK